jgi:hypothetical protein
MIRGTFLHRVDVDGRIIESDLIVCQPDEWEELPERADTEWCALRLGPQVFALRLRGLIAVADPSTYPTSLGTPNRN